MELGLEVRETTTQIFIVEDHPIMRHMVRSYLEEKSEWKVCGEADTASSAREQVPEAEPDLVLIDVALPDMSGIELARVLKEQHPNLILVMLSGHGQKSYIDQALEAGALGYILKGNGKELMPALQEILRGEVYVSPTLTA